MHPTAPYPSMTSPIAQAPLPSIDWHHHLQFRKAIYAKYPELDLPKFLLAPEIRQLASLPINQHQRMLLLTLFNTGARINELLDLTPNRIDRTAIDTWGDQGPQTQYVSTVTIRTLKQQRRAMGKAPRDHLRTITLYDPAFAEELMRYKATYGTNARLPLFRNHHKSHSVRISAQTQRRRKNDKAISDQTARNWLSSIQDEAGNHGIELMIPLTPKVLRHSCAIHLMLNGFTQEQVRTHLGHKSIKNTAIYTNMLNLNVNMMRTIQF